MDEWLNGYFGQEKLSKQYLRKIFPLYVDGRGLKAEKARWPKRGVIFFQDR